ncbi:MAG: hypothetical protein ABIQ09_15645 [Jatrophihabitantaceae bacterium]
MTLTETEPGDYLTILLTLDVPESAQPLGDKLIEHPADRHFSLPQNFL